MSLKHEWVWKMERAELRCMDISRAERIWGYDESADIYRAMSVEMNAAKWWALGLREIDDIPVESAGAALPGVCVDTVPVVAAGRVRAGLV